MRPFLRSTSAYDQTVIAEYFPLECNCIYGNCNVSSAKQTLTELFITLVDNRLS